MSGRGGQRGTGARAALAVLVSGAVLGLPAIGAAQDAVIPDLLFVSDAHGDTICDQPFTDIYVLEAGQPRRITDARAQTPDADAYCSIGYEQPALSPDGTQIAAVRREGSSSFAVVMAADGSGQQVISAAGEGHVRTVGWSPDGTRIVHDGHDLNVLTIVDLATGDATAIPGSDGFSDPDWSPDGSLIAFAGPPSDEGVTLGSSMTGASGSEAPRGGGIVTGRGGRLILGAPRALAAQEAGS